MKKIITPLTNSADLYTILKHVPLGAVKVEVKGYTWDHDPEQMYMTMPSNCTTFTGFGISYDAEQDKGYAALFMLYFRGTHTPETTLLGLEKPYVEVFKVTREVAADGSIHLAGYVSDAHGKHLYDFGINEIEFITD